MTYRKLLKIAICLTSVFVLVGTAQAFNWYGFSDLEVRGEDIKGSQDNYFVFELTDVTIELNCINKNAESSVCLPGTAHEAEINFEATPDATGDKDKGRISFYERIPLDKYDEHSNKPHTHSCFPYENDNYIEVSGSARIYSFTAYWWQYDSKDHLKNSGYDVCQYNGVIDPETCLPENKQLVCQEFFLGK